MNKLVVFQDEAGEWRWHVKAGNGEIVADSAEGYENRADCLDMAHLLLDANVEFEVEE